MHDETLPKKASKTPFLLDVRPEILFMNIRQGGKLHGGGC